MILFLDFDGVLHRFGDRITDYCRFLPRLEAVLRDYPDVKIVVSSDWRKHHTLEELHGFFFADIGKRVVGLTPVLQSEMNPQGPTGIRRHEAMAWMQEMVLPTLGSPWTMILGTGSPTTFILFSAMMVLMKRKN